MAQLEHCPECGAILDDPTDQSDAARRRYFAIVRNAWQNLPDHWRLLCPTSEHLRKHMLIKVGYCDTQVIRCGSSVKALEVAALAKRLDGYVVCDIRGPVVAVSMARSQRKRAQPKKAFMECSELVYTALAEVLGTDPASLQEAA